VFSLIITVSLRRRLFVCVAAIIVMAGGLWLARDMPVDLLPELYRPTVTLITEAGGRGPEDVETLITFPIERALSGIPAHTRIRSMSFTGLSIAHVEFEWNSDPYRARQLVNERVSQIRQQLPADVTPTLAPLSSTMGVVMIVAVTATDIPPMDLRDAVDWIIRPQLLAVPGVSEVYVVGGEVRQIRFAPDLAAMRRYGVSLAQIEEALASVGTNSSGGFTDLSTQEYIIRAVGRTTRLDDLRNVPVSQSGRAITVGQLGEVSFVPRFKRGDGSYDGEPAILLTILKQPSVNTVDLSDHVQATLHQLSQLVPAGIRLDHIAYNQADLIVSSIDNVRRVLKDAIIIVAVVLILLLLNVRTTLISLVAIPASLLMTVIVFKIFGLSINTMTLGGLAIAIGELVDDAVVGVENVQRRIAESAAGLSPRALVSVITEASKEVRSGIVYSTVIIMLVLVPLFVLPGVEGRLFAPLGIAYIVSIFCSLIVAISLTPALCYFLIGRPKGAMQHGSFLLRWLKRLNRAAVSAALDHAWMLLIAGVALLGLASILVFELPRTFLPPFNEGTLYVAMLNKPGISLAESDRIGLLAERLLMRVPEVESIARRTGRNEFDEDADGVQSSEMPIILRASSRSRAEIADDIRNRLSVLPVSVEVTQFLTSRMQVMMTGARGELVLKIFGDDFATLRSLANSLKPILEATPGLVDVLVEPQEFTPQIQIVVDYERARLFGVTPTAIAQTIENLFNGRVVSQIMDGRRAVHVVVRLAEDSRSDETLSQLMVETPNGKVPLSTLARIETAEAPNEIVREDGRRRLVIQATASGRDMRAIAADVQARIAAVPLPPGYQLWLDGSFREQERTQWLIPALSLVSLSLIVLVLQARYRSMVLTLIIMGNVPLAFIGGILALYFWSEPLSAASMIGFITLTGISTRNGILKISHFINLALSEGESFGRKLILRGCDERLAPVLMTALCAGLALIPLLAASDLPGTEILHPVAIVVFGGLVSSTILDLLTTPVLFHRFGERPLRRLMTEVDDDRALEVF
jgi:HME family heavy-metal exporter